MDRRDLRSRAAGIAILVGAGAISLAHGAAPVGAATVHASSIDLSLALASFVLACLGLLLIIQGARLRDGWVSACKRAERDRTALKRDGQKSAVTEIDPTVLWDPGLGGGRLALSTFLILRAQQQAAQAREVPTPKQSAPAEPRPHLQRESR